MAPRDPTNAQLSSRLNYNSGQTPSFLLKLQARVAGRAPDDDEDDEQPAYADDDAFEAGASGRPPIPRRPPPPRRPRDQPGSGDEDARRAGEDGAGELDEEDGEDEAPQVVVLREGKHLSKGEAENERRRAKGLAPLPDPADGPPPAETATAKKGQAAPAGQPSGVTFGKTSKRKAAKDVSEDKDAGVGERKASRKKPKKAEKKLLSFGDDA